MGCSCNKNSTESSPSINFTPSNWGPTFWKVIHTLVERTGFKSDIYQDADEKHLWLFLIKLLGEILPCYQCRTHYNEYYIMNHPTSIINKTYSERRDGLRVWFYNLHLKTPKLSDCPVPTLEELPTMYSLSVIDIENEIKVMVSLLTSAVNQGVVSGLAFYNFKSKLGLLKLTLL
jgi:hypothetical protein